MSHTIHNVGAAKHIGKYSDAIETESGLRWLFTSGTPGVADDGKIPPGIEAQSRLGVGIHRCGARESQDDDRRFGKGHDVVDERCGHPGIREGARRVPGRRKARLHAPNRHSIDQAGSPRRGRDRGRSQITLGRTAPSRPRPRGEAQRADWPRRRVASVRIKARREIGSPRSFVCDVRAQRSKDDDRQEHPDEEKIGEVSRSRGSFKGKHFRILLPPLRIPPYMTLWWSSIIENEFQRGNVPIVDARRIALAPQRSQEVRSFSSIEKTSPASTLMFRTRQLRPVMSLSFAS